MLVGRTSVGLDVDARSVAAAAIDGVTGEVRQARLTPSHDHIRSWVVELAGPVAVTYEPGPTGFGLYRSLTQAGIRCVVAAPSKLQRPCGDRVKTDAKDAVQLARLLRLGELTAGRGQRVHPGGAPAGLSAGRVDVDRVRARRGDRRLHRFSGNSIGSFVGLVPSEHSSGASRVQGSITKTGNTHARRLLVEAAWHHRATYRPGKTMRDRWELAPPAARARGDAGNRRLHNRWISFNLRRKRPVIANVAVARELAGWCWSLAVLNSRPDTAMD